MTVVEEVVKAALPWLGGMAGVTLIYFGIMLHFARRKVQHLKVMRKQLARIEARQITGGRK